MVFCRYALDTRLIYHYPTIETYDVVTTASGLAAVGDDSEIAILAVCDGVLVEPSGWLNHDQTDDATTLSAHETQSIITSYRIGPDKKFMLNLRTNYSSGSVSIEPVKVFCANKIFSLFTTDPRLSHTMRMLMSAGDTPEIRAA